jgi:hypothetical protein
LHPVPNRAVSEKLRRGDIYLPTLIAPSQLELMPRFALWPAATLTLLSIVPKLVLVYKKTDSEQELTTLRDWA